MILLSIYETGNGNMLLEAFEHRTDAITAVLEYLEDKDTELVSDQFTEHLAALDKDGKKAIVHQDGTISLINIKESAMKRTSELTN